MHSLIVCQVFVFFFTFSTNGLSEMRLITADIHKNIYLVNDSSAYFEAAWLMTDNVTIPWDKVRYQKLSHSTIVMAMETNKYAQNIAIDKFVSKLTNLFYMMFEENPCGVSEIYQVREKVVSNHFQICAQKDLYQLVYPRRRRSNFHQTTVSVSTYDVEGILGSVDSTGVMRGNFAAENTLRDLQFMLNFRVKLEVMTNIDGSNDSYFVPMADKLNSGQADLGIGYFYVVTPRAEIATPLIPLASDGLFAFFGQPPSNSVRNIYVLPLNWDITTTIIIVLTFIGLTILVFKNILEKKSSNASINVCDILLWTISSVCQSGHNIYSRKLSVQILSLTGEILGFAFFTLYCSRLLSILVLPMTPVTQVSDLLKYDYTFYSPPALKQFVFNTEANLKVRPYSGSHEWSNSLIAVLTERHAHIDVKLESMNGFLWFIRRANPPLVRPTDQLLCEKVSIVQYSNSTVFLANGFYIPKSGSQLRGHFNLGILKIRETGLIKRYLKFTGPEGLSCPPKQTAYQENLSIDDVLSAILLYVMLVLVAGVLFLLERFIFGKVVFC